MKIPLDLPDDLSKECKAIEKEFEHIKGHWRKYPDGRIPTDPVLSKRIVHFILNVAKHFDDHYDEINQEQCYEFLGYYRYNFRYGPNDQRNYLSFDVTLDGQTVYDFFWVLIEDGKGFTKERLKIFAGKCEKWLSKI